MSAKSIVALRLYAIGCIGNIMTISVSQLNNYIKGVFDLDAVLDNVSVAGEITNVKAYGSGWFFSLKDEQGAINCFCYASNVRPEQGAKAVVEGKINYWVKSGSVSFFVRRFTVSNETGEAYRRFVELRDKLAKEGLFDEIRKQPVPHCCQKIGVVTSPTGAVIHDIENVALRRQPFCDIVLYPVKVQGKGSAEEICQGIAYFDKSDVDVIIVGRGGGSNEDLSVFNEENIVRQIAACGKPVVSAVGHGVDFTLCDFVADKRAVTPSEAAEFVTIDVASEKNKIGLRLCSLLKILQNRAESYAESVSVNAKRIVRETERQLAERNRRVSDVLLQSSDKIENTIERCRMRADKAVATLSAANPTNVLKRGYAYATKNGKNVSSVKSLRSGDTLNLTFADGSADVEVK